MVSHLYLSSGLPERKGGVMARREWYIQEAFRTPLPYTQEAPYQLSLVLFPCLE